MKHRTLPHKKFSNIKIFFQYFPRIPESTTRDTETDIPTQFNLPSKKPLLTTEHVKAFYQADLFVPGVFDKIFFLCLGLVGPFMDYATDYYNAGLDNNI